MSLTEQIYAQALVLIQDSTDVNLALLNVLCRSAENTLRQKPREGITPEDCKADFVAAASLLALAALASAAEDVPAEQITAGDFTVKKGGRSHDAAANCLKNQAELMIAPYLKDGFLFTGV
jgi:hypothetical protein